MAWSGQGGRAVSARQGGGRRPPVASAPQSPWSSGSRAWARPQDRLGRARRPHLGAVTSGTGSPPSTCAAWTRGRLLPRDASARLLHALGIVGGAVPAGTDDHRGNNEQARSRAGGRAGPVAAPRAGLRRPGRQREAIGAAEASELCRRDLGMALRLPAPYRVPAAIGDPFPAPPVSAPLRPSVGCCPGPPRSSRSRCT